MTLTLHQLRKDIRQFWMLLLILAALLALDLSADLGWLAKVTMSGGDRPADILAALLPTAVWVLLFLIPSMVVLADSPARREGFLGTRPMPKRDLWLAKLIFIFGLIVLPAVAQSVVYLWLEGVPVRFVAQGGLEHLLWILPVAVCAASFAALWKSYTEWAASLGIFLGGLILQAYAASWLKNWLGPINSVDDLQAMIVTLLTLAPGLALLAVWNARQSRKPRWRWCGVAIVVAVWCGAGAVWPWTQTELAPADAAAARALVEKTDLRLTPRSIRMYESSDDRHGAQISLALDFPPPLNESASGDFVQWVNAGTKLLRPSGQALASSGSPERGPVFKTFSATILPWQQIQSMAGLLPQDTLAEVGMVGSYAEGATDLGRFNLDPGGEILREPLAVQARLEGRAFRWTKVADLPIQAGQSAKDDFGQWTIASLDNWPPYVGLFLQRKELALELSSDQRANNPPGPVWPSDKFALVFYHPERKVAFVADGMQYAYATRAATTRFPQLWIRVNFSGQQASGPLYGMAQRELAQCRLLIFQKTWLGNAARDWQSAPFTYNDLQIPGNAAAGNNGESLTSGELDRRLAALNRPGPGASRQEVSLYLLEYLRLMDARRFWARIRPQDPVISGLAALAPEHLDILLDGLPAMSPLCRRAVIAALAEGVLESQKAAVIAAVPRAPELAAVLLARGWVDDAHDALYQLLDSPRALPVESLQAIASFADPRTYPRLLQELESNPNEPLYDALRALPGIAGPLDATVTRLWRDQTVVVRPFNDISPALRLALRAGKPEALAWACHLAEEINAGVPMALNPPNSVLDGVIELPSVPAPASGQPGNFVASLTGRSAGDFVFDPARQRFVLKEKLHSAADTAPRPSSP
jgi:hypothetical protein